MLQVTCIQKFRNKQGQIYGYRLQDDTGVTRDVKANALKAAIINNNVQVTNLTLTSDNRLIDAPQSTAKHTQPHIKPTQQKVDINGMLNKAKLLGLETKEIKTKCGNPCYLISKSDIEHIIFIPDNVTKLNDSDEDRTFTWEIEKLKGNIKVIGGNNLVDTISMFVKCEAKSLDLSSFNTSKVTEMGAMFSECKAESIDLSSFDTSNVTNMGAMFWGCEVQSLDLSSFDTSNVTNMTDMFSWCRTGSINLSSFNTSKVTDMGNMFEYCRAKSLDLSSFDTSNATDMSYMFAACNAKYINLSSFNTSKMENMKAMFDGCKATIQTTDKRILEKYNSRKPKAYN